MAETSLSLRGLVILQKRRSFAVLVDNSRSSEADLLSIRTRHSNEKSEEEQSGHDCKGKDPLEGNNLAEELADAKRCGQDAQSETHGVVIEGHKEEKPVDEDTPDSNVGKDTSDQRVGIDSNRTIPVDGNKGPRQRSRDDRRMDEACVAVVTEVERGEVEEVDDKQNFSPDKVRAYEEHDKAELQEVVHNEVASHCRSSVDTFGVG